MDRDSCFPLVTGQNGPATNKWKSFHLHYGALATYFPIVMDRRAPAVGPFFSDVDGNQYLDFVSHVGAAPFGYNHPDMVSFMKKIPLIDPMRYAGTDFISGYGPDPGDSDIPTPSHLHHKIKKISRSIGLTHSFFTNSGAEAVENAIKLAYFHQGNRGYGVCFEGGFHGRTLGALSFNRSKVVQKAFFPAVPNVLSLPYCRCPGKCGCAWEEDGMTCLEKALDPKYGLYEPEELSFVIIEPVQGEGGYRVPSKKFMKDIYTLTKTHGIPLICDEVQCGLGRTGTWWASEQFRIKPSLLSTAKSLRLGATVGQKEFFPDEPGHIASTFGEGNALASAMACKTIDIIQKYKLLKNAKQKGKYFLKHLKEYENKKHVEDVRGLGLMLGLECDSISYRNMVLKKCLKKGLLVAGTGHKAIRFIPPLDVTKREIDICLDILDTVL